MIGIALIGKTLFCAPKRQYGLTIALLITFNTALAYGQGELGNWIERAPLPTPRQEMPLVVLESMIYVIGGIDANRFSSEIVEVYNPASNTWTEKATLPPALHHQAAAAALGKLYTFGGYVGGFSPTDRVYAYDPSTDSWTEMSPMSATRGAQVAVTVDEKIYVIGGQRDGIALSTNQEYNPATNSWTERAPLPTPREHLAAAALNGKIYVIGGRARIDDALTNLRTVEVYDPKSDSWDRSVADLPQASGGLAATALNGRLYAFGGEYFEDGAGVYDMNVEYNPADNTWRSLAPMPLPRHGIGAVALADTIYIIGGGPQAGFATTDVNAGFIPPQPEILANDDPTNIAEAFIHPGYPNPFYTSTTLQFSLNKPTTIALSIVDVQGREITSLLQGYVLSGSHQINWHPTALLPAGVYFVILRTESKTLSHPIVKY